MTYPKDFEKNVWRELTNRKYCTQRIRLRYAARFILDMDAMACRGEGELSDRYLILREY